MPTDVYTVTAVIPTGASASQPISFAEYHTISLWMPAAWTAATLAMQASLSGAEPASDADWRTIFTDTAELALPAGAGRVLSVPAGILVPAGARWVRLISGTVATRVNQAAQRDILAAFRRF